MMTKSKALKIASAAAVLVITATLTDTAQAQSRKPLEASERRESALQVDHRPVVLERVRTEGKRFAVFFAEPQAIEPDRIVVFEIASAHEQGTTPRWRCIAVEDVAECLGTPVRLRYLWKGERMRLTATAHDRASPEGIAFTEDRASNLVAAR